MASSSTQYSRPPSDDPRQIISALLTNLAGTTTPQLQQSQASQSANPLRDTANPQTRAFLLTLYTLFDTTLLPALDLLDRNLITRLRHANTSLLLVRSAQTQQQQRTYEHVNYHEVRLDAWTCSCPAFAFSAFPATANDHDDKYDVVASGKALFGGMTRGSGIAVCKHLLACVLVEHCDMFAHFVEEREVSAEEIAGWAAGWGN